MKKVRKKNSDCENGFNAILALCLVLFKGEHGIRLGGSLQFIDSNDHTQIFLNSLTLRR